MVACQCFILLKIKLVVFNHLFPPNAWLNEFFSSLAPLCYQEKKSSFKILLEMVKNLLFSGTLFTVSNLFFIFLAVSHVNEKLLAILFLYLH